MRNVYVIFGILLWCSSAFAQQVQGTDYVLTIEGVDHEMALGKETQIKLKSGQDILVLLKKQEFGKFTAGNLTFEYPGTLSVASTPVDPGITQHIVVTGLGTMMLIQHYEDDVPSGLLDLMFDKMVEEPKALGIPIKRTVLNRAISNGVSLEGVRAYYKGGDDDVTIDIAIKQTDKGGYMVLTMHDAYTSPEEKPMIERFWQNLILTP